MVKEHIECGEISQNFNGWMETQHQKINNVERKYEQEVIKYDGQFQEIKSKAVKYVDEMSGVLKLAKSAYDDLSTYIKKTTDMRCATMERYVDKEIERIDGNMAKMNDALSEWRPEVDEKLSDHDSRIESLEKFVEEWKEHWKNGSRNQFWSSNLQQ